jgi:GTPase SAR1 family protein
MGACASQTDEQKASREIEARMREARQEEESKVKLLLLGAGGCGKSTFFKQIKSMYGAPPTEGELLNFKQTVNANVSDNVTALMELGVRDLGIKVDPAVSEAWEKAKAIMAQPSFGKPGNDLSSNPELVQMLMKLWGSAAVKEALERQSEFQLQDSTDYFFERLTKSELEVCSMPQFKVNTKLDSPPIGDPTYVCGSQDILRIRVRTSGIVEKRYLIQGNEFVVIDVGGQRNERRKWIHCFQDVTAIIFLMAASGYDKVLFEDASQNRLLESLQLWDKIVNSPYFGVSDIKPNGTTFILFLNKYDLFQSKIAKKDIRNMEKAWFTDYEGGCQEISGIEYIEGLYRAKIHGERKIVMKRTVATDPSNMQEVFTICRNVILQANISDSGF